MKLSICIALLSLSGFLYVSEHLKNHRFSIVCDTGSPTKGEELIYLAKQESIYRKAIILHKDNLFKDLKNKEQVSCCKLQLANITRKIQSSIHLCMYQFYSLNNCRKQAQCLYAELSRLQFNSEHQEAIAQIQKTLDSEQRSHMANLFMQHIDDVDRYRKELCEKYNDTLSRVKTIRENSVQHLSDIELLKMICDYKIIKKQHEQLLTCMRIRKNKKRDDDSIIIALEQQIEKCHRCFKQLEKIEQAFFKVYNRTMVQN